MTHGGASTKTDKTDKTGRLVGEHFTAIRVGVNKTELKHSSGKKTGLKVNNKCPHLFANQLIAVQRDH